MPLTGSIGAYEYVCIAFRYRLILGMFLLLIRLIKHFFFPCLGLFGMIFASDWTYWATFFASARVKLVKIFPLGLAYNA